MTFGQCIQVYKKKFIHKRKCTNKVIIFDLDETLGCFTDLEALWGVIDKNVLPYNNIYLTKQLLFNALLDLYPEFLRYGILNILEYLNYKKSIGHFIGIYLYTNNQVSKTWSKYITNYLDYKISASGLFKQIVYAFKINKRIVEPLRKSNSKTYSDFIRCSLLPRNTEMCFIDNTYYTKMHHNKVYYIQPKPFFHGMKTGDIIQRLMGSHILKINDDKIFMSHFLDNNLITSVEKSQKNIDEDTYVSRKILYHIQDFFLLTTRTKRTHKNKTLNIGNFTRKNK